MHKEDSKNRIEERQAKRLIVLRAAYDACDGDFGSFEISATSLVAKTGLSPKDVVQAAKYLVGQGLAKLKSADVFTLTYEGCRQAEVSYTEADEGTEQFSPAVINNTNHFNASVGTVQTGDHNAASMNPVAPPGEIENRHLISEFKKEHRQIRSFEDTSILSLQDKEILQAISDIIGIMEGKNIIFSYATIMKFLLDELVHRLPKAPLQRSQSTVAKPDQKRTKKMSKHSRLAVIITALPLEREAVLEHLREIKEEPPLRGSIYRKGTFDDRSEPWEVVVAEIGAGNEGAAAEAERVIAHYAPQIALFVGVAGAIKDLEHGDVVASTKVYAYESGKDRRKGFESRPSVELPAYALEQRARYEAGESDWLQRIKVGTPASSSAPSAKVGPIAAGEKVLASNRTPIYNFIRNNYGDAMAVEMEGHGFLRGVRMNEPTRGLVVRGISDKISNKKPKGDDTWQPIAAQHAAAFAFQIISKIDVNAGDTKDSHATKIDKDWLIHHLEDARRTAGPRYSTEMRVGMPLHTIFESLCETDVWFESIRPYGRKLREARRRWSQSVKTTTSTGWATSFPEKLRNSGEAIDKQLANIEHIFTNLMERRNGASPQCVAAAATMALPLLRQLHIELREDLEARHGKGTADSAQFRQFQAEYNAEFPAANVDGARDLVAQLEELEKWGLSDEGRVAGACGMLLVGVAGVGKTHAICDIAHDRSRRGLCTVVVFGEHFGDSDEPWDKLGRQLGFGVVTRDELLATLDAAGKSSAGPLLLCIDGMNESRPRLYWRNRLASFAVQVSRYPYIRLCVSCRSTYETLVIPEGHKLERVEHPGFKGMESTACREFFAHYNLEPPTGPSFHTEFSNPLFLRLICETLKAANLQRMPRGWNGISTAIKALLLEKNKAFAREFERDARDRVPQRALDEFLSEAERARRVFIPWHDASAALNRVQPAGLSGPSILEWLVREGMLIADVSPVVGDTDETEDVVRIAFERLGEHLLAARLLRQASAGGLEESICAGPLFFVFSSDEAILENRGLIEALSIQLPEHKELHCELVDALPPSVSQKNILAATVTALPWRDPEYITDRTREIIYQALTTPRMGQETFDNLLAIACQETPLDAFWLHNQLCSMTLSHRDAFLCPYLHLRVGNAGVVEHLLLSARNLDACRISERIILRWAVILLWFCAAADRRVRDRATRGLVAITESRPYIWVNLIEMFASVDDDYIIERCFCAAYGTMLRTRNPEVERVVALAAYKTVFVEPINTQNALVRDFSRCIVELAAHDGVLDSTINIATVCPPYQSEWPLKIPTSEEVEQYDNSRKDYPGLYASCLNGDFSHYLLSRLAPYEDVLSRSEMGRWVLNHVVQDLGYGGTVFKSYDGHMIYQHGGGRGRPVWAERIGKKYQWIALARLAARVTDNIKPKHDSWEGDLIGVPLTYYSGRDFDPSWLGVVRSQSTGPRCWWLPNSYDFASVDNLSHEKWVSVSKDFPLSADFLAPVAGPDGRQWQLLEAYPTWDSRPKDEEQEYPYRQLWIHIRGYLVASKSARKVFQWLAKQNFTGRWMMEGTSFNEVFLGEYPWGHRFLREEEEYYRQVGGRQACPARIVPVCNSISSSYSEDCSQTDGVSILVPTKPFFQDEPLLRWDGLGGFGLQGKPSRFYDPSVCEQGCQSLLVDRLYLLDYLERTRQCLVWTVLGEKLLITGSIGGSNILNISQAHLMGSDGQLTSSALLTKSIR